MQTKVFGLLLLTISLLGMGSLLFKEVRNDVAKSIGLPFDQRSRYLKINMTWKQDIKRLIEDAQIPMAWNEINQVMFLPTDPITVELAEKLVAPIRINSSGIYRLDISIISHQSEDEKTQIVLQHNLIDTRNDNTIWELNRTYNLN